MAGKRANSLGFGLTILVLAYGAPALSASLTNAQRSAYERAYHKAQWCFSATTTADDTAGSKLSFDAVVKLGGLLGYDNRKLNTDLKGGVELVEFARSDAVLRDALADCARIGLASH